MSHHIAKLCFLHLAYEVAQEINDGAKVAELACWALDVHERAPFWQQLYARLTEWRSLYLADSDAVAVLFDGMAGSLVADVSWGETVGVAL